MNTILNNKLELTSGEVVITTPGENTSLDEIDFTLVKEDDHIINHSVYPSGLILLTVTRANKISHYSNWNFKLNDDGNYTMEKP